MADYFNSVDYFGFVEAIASPLPTSRFRQGIVTAVATDSCSVQISGDTSTTVTGVKYMNSYFPAVNDAVWMVTDGADLFIVGALGTATSAWRTYTPTLTNITNHNGTTVAYFCQIGKTVFLRIKITFGSNTTMGTNPLMSLPVNASTDQGTSYFGYSSHFYDSSTGVQYLGGSNLTTTTVRPLAVGTAGTYANYATVNLTTPFSANWGVNDILTLQCVYEGA